MEQIIGPIPILCWASSNIALESSANVRQAVHSDAYADIRNFIFCVEMNIYLQDTTPENGSIELWPGTHVFTEEDHLPPYRGFIKKNAFTDRARTCPPIYPTVPAG
jgi:ectoine hydroxylase-related dioxygenase (phytanoyl-CoA dioxygenase family)